MASLGVLLGMIGAVFVALDVSIVANVIWSVSNIMLIYRAHKMDDKDGIKLFAVYEIISIYGVYRYLSMR